MTFTRPTIGPKVYLSRGPSGHNETFLRGPADLELEKFLGLVNSSIAIEGFIRKINLRGDPERWVDVIAFLGELTKLDADNVPIVVAVSFWAKVNEMRESIQRASGN